MSKLFDGGESMSPSSGEIEDRKSHGSDGGDQMGRHHTGDQYEGQCP